MQFSTDELRMISLSAPILLKMLKGRESRIIMRIHGEFRAGKENQLPAIAELSCVRDQIHEIEQAINQLQTRKE